MEGAGSLLRWNEDLIIACLLHSSSSGSPRGTVMGGAKVLCGVLVVLLPALGVCAGADGPSDSSAMGSLKLSAFNIQIFGVSKFSNPQVVGILSRVSGGMALYPITGLGLTRTLGGRGVGLVVAHLQAPLLPGEHLVQRLASSIAYWSVIQYS